MKDPTDLQVDLLHLQNAVSDFSRAAERIIKRLGESVEALGVEINKVNELIK